MRPAIIDTTVSEEISFSRLETASRSFAAILAGEQGVGRGDRVPLIARNRISVFVQMLACRQLNAVMVPLSWRLSAGEIEMLKADCLAPATVSPPDDLAMLVYTSGTTGKPKGVMLTWSQIDFNAAVTASVLELGPDDRCLAFLPLCHTGGLHCLATPLLAAGGTVVLADFEPERTVELLERHRITCIIAVPTIYQMLLEAGIERRVPRLALRHLLVGGASTSETLFERYEAIGLPLLHGYGLTEAGPNCFSFGRRDVGQPMPGTRAALADDGELVLSGPHVAAGYWNDPELTEATFGGGWLKTGDLAGQQSGRFFITGRKKDIYISGGENICPPEVESAIAAHPAVADVCVVGVPDERWGEVGLAAVVPRRSGSIEPEGLDGFVRQRIAGFKVPRHWRFVSELPKGATGKVVRSEVAKLLR